MAGGGLVGCVCAARLAGWWVVGWWVVCAARHLRRKQSLAIVELLNKSPLQRVESA